MTAQGTQEQARALAATAEDILASIWGSYQAGDLTESEFTDQASAALEAVLEQASMFADASLAETLDTEPSGVELPDPGPHLLKALGTLLLLSKTDPKYNAAQQLRLIARAEVYVSVQNTTSKALQAQGVAGWRRIAHPTSCSACKHLAVRKFLPSSVEMWQHLGCSCLQQPEVEAPDGTVSDA